MVDNTRGAGTEDQKRSPSHACLAPLLNALNWPGDARHLCEVMPDCKSIPDFASLCEVLGNLEYCTVPFNLCTDRLVECTLPALHLTADNDLWVIVEAKQQGSFLVFKGHSSRLETVQTDDFDGQIFLVRPAENTKDANERGSFGWAGSFLAQHRPLIHLFLVLTFCINLAALATPIYLLSIYDLAIGNRSMTTLVVISGAIAIIFATEIGFREMRARAIARFAIRAQMSIMEAVFGRITRLPLGLIKSASLTGQMNRLRSFEAIREIFSGALGASLLDLPFIPIFVCAIFVFDSTLGWLAAVMIGLLMIFSILVFPLAQARVKRAGQVQSDLRLFRMDMNSNLLAVRSCGAEEIWDERYQDHIRRQLLAEAAARCIRLTEQALASALCSIFLTLIVTVGTLSIMAGDLSLGALAAVMALVWRMLTPMHTILLNLNRLLHGFETIRQLDRLMWLPQESSRIRAADQHRITGQVELERVGFRGGGHALPLLRNVSMRADAGQMTALVGVPGPSRSVVLELLARLRRPSSGRILIDGFDARQFDVRGLRQDVALICNDQVIVSGSLAYNFWLVNPLADDGQIRQAIRDADLEDFVKGLEHGIDTDLTPLLTAGLNVGVQHKIRLARAYVQDPAIYLFDEPVKDLDMTARRVFINKLYELKGQATVFVRTSDEDILSLADQIAHFDAGRLIRLDRSADVDIAAQTDRLRALLEHRERAEERARVS